MDLVVVRVETKSSAIDYVVQVGDQKDLGSTILSLVLGRDCVVEVRSPTPRDLDEDANVCDDADDFFCETVSPY